ncbi:MAG: DsbA family protein [Pseudomonadota bacterium]
MKPVAAGTRHCESFHPDASQLASALGNHGVDVVSTVDLILYFEETANNLVRPFFEAGEIAVGTHVNIDHLAPAFPSEAVEVCAELTRHQGKRLEFALEAKQGDTVVMRGVHHRALMARDRFETSTTQDRRTPTGLEFWFDFHSPWCYFAVHGIGEIAQAHDVAVQWRPVHLANLIEAIDGGKPLEGDAGFVSWYKQDQHDTAKMLGLPFDPHRDYPKRPSRALRASLYAADQGLAEPFIKRVMQGYWSEQKDISDLAWLAQVAHSLQMDPDALCAATASDEYKLRVIDNHHAAIERGVFGLPTVCVDGKRFWGNDRLDLLRHFLSGKAPGLNESE